MKLCERRTTRECGAVGESWAMPPGCCLPGGQAAVQVHCRGAKSPGNKPITLAHSPAKSHYHNEKLEAPQPVAQPSTATIVRSIPDPTAATVARSVPSPWPSQTLPQQEAPQLCSPLGYHHCNKKNPNPNFATEMRIYPDLQPSQTSPACSQGIHHCMYSLHAGSPLMMDKYTTNKQNPNVKLHC
ncbi:hypothetical protein AOLI_G00003640 [Acnodon oligacanthus]